MANDRAGLTNEKPDPLDDASTQLSSQNAMAIAVLLLMVGLVAFGDLASRAGPL